LRQRTVGRPEEVANEGIFIGDVEEPIRSVKEKIGGNSESSSWKRLSIFLAIATVLSVCGNVFQYRLLSSHQHSIQELHENSQNFQAEWTADRHSVEECRSEMTKMETHMNNRENEKTELEKEIARLRRAIENGGVTENPHEGDTPPTPHPEQGYPTRPNHQELEEQQRLEQQRREEEERRQAEEQQRQEEELRRQQEEQRQQEELQRQQEEQQRQQEELQRQQEQQRQEEEQRLQQEEQQRQLEEQQRQQQEQQQQQHQEG